MQTFHALGVVKAAAKVGHSELTAHIDHLIAALRSPETRLETARQWGDITVQGSSPPGPSAAPSSCPVSARWRATAATLMFACCEVRARTAKAAVGMEAHGHDEPRSTKLTEIGQKATGLLPGSLAAKVSDQAALDRLDALHTAVKAVRRGGTVSISGVYGGAIDPMPMMEMFDRGVQLRMARPTRRFSDQYRARQACKPAPPRG